jgi:hypothetical protein
MLRKRQPWLTTLVGTQRSDKGLLTPDNKEASMSDSSPGATQPFADIVQAMGEEPVFKAGDAVTIAMRYPIGHFRVPNSIRGKHGRVEAVIESAAINNEEEGFGRNAGDKRNSCFCRIRGSVGCN